MVKFRLAQVFAFSLVMLLGTSLVVAQEQGQRPGRGGRGGFGGSRLSGVLSILGNEEVQKELALDEATGTNLKKVLETAGAEARTELGNAGGGREAFQNLSQDERAAKMRELQAKGAEVQAKIAAKFQPQVKEILTPAQYERAQQIYWQSSTVQALSDPDLIKALEVTKEQQDKIAEVGKEFDAKRRELFSGGRGQGGGGAGGFEKMAELNKERDTKVVDVLSAEQKEKFTKLKGKEFDVAKLRGFGGRGGRPGGRPAGGRPATE